MADETTLTTANDIRLAAVVDANVLEERRPYNVMRPFFYWLSHGPSNIADFPNITDPGAGGASVEATGLSNTALGTGKASATLGTVGMMATITDELRSDSIPDVYQLFGPVLARSTEEKFQTDATALLDDFSNTTNTAGVAGSYSMLQEAVNQLAQRDVVGTPIGVLDPADMLEVQQDLGTSGAAAFGNPSFDIDALNISLNASVGRLAGADWFQTSLVTSTGGAVFVKERALAAYEGWANRTEPDRDASMPGTEMVNTERYGLVEREDASGETILS